MASPAVAVEDRRPQEEEAGGNHVQDETVVISSLSEGERVTKHPGDINGYVLVYPRDGSASNEPPSFAHVRSLRCSKLTPA